VNILIACEFSGIVRDAFLKKGHLAVSCDLIPTESPGPHYAGDVEDILDSGWDMMIAHPPCTYLTVTANRYFRNNPERWEKRLEAVKFVYKLLNANIPRICIENPKGVISTHIRKPDQYIQPYEFGHKDSKMTGLWLKGLPLLVGTKRVEPEWVTFSSGKRMSKTHAGTPSTSSEENRKIRSRTYHGIAEAMAAQWG
jgi:hypothetical protein